MNKVRCIMVTLVCGLLWGSQTTAAAQLDRSFDLQLRRPAMGPDDTLLSRGTATVAHLDTAFGIDGDLSTRSVVAEARSGGDSAVVQTRAVVTLGLAMGLTDRAQLEISMPVSYQGGDGLEQVTGDADDGLLTGTLGDLRGSGLLRLLDPTALGPVTLSLALSGWLGFPTGDAASFSSTGGLAGGLTTVVRLALEGWYATFETGAQLRRRSELLGEAIGNELLFIGTLGTDLFDGILGLALGLEGHVGLASRAVHRAIWLGEIRGRFFPDRRLQVALGAGTGLGDALTSPDFQTVLSFRFTPTEYERQEAPRSLGVGRSALAGSR